MKIKIGVVSWIASNGERHLLDELIEVLNQKGIVFMAYEIEGEHASF
jgi:hypothetical protein